MSEVVANSKGRTTDKKKSRGNPKRTLKKGGGGEKFVVGRPEDDMNASSQPTVGDPIYDDTTDDDHEERYQTRYDQEARLAAKVGVSLDYDPTTAKRIHGDAMDEAEAISKADDDNRVQFVEYKRRVREALTEYFSNEDLDEFAVALNELRSPFFRFEMVKQAVVLAMDRTDRERELVSRALSELYGSLLSQSQLSKGFQRLLEVVEDVSLDVPNAKSLLAKFIARAVNDEILAPSFLSDDAITTKCEPVAESARSLLDGSHHGSRVGHVWHSGKLESVEELKRDIQMLVSEFFVSEDMVEAQRCVNELDVPHFHHEVVKQLITVALDKGEEKIPLASALLTFLVTEKSTSKVQVKKGFDRVREQLDDLKLDVPAAEKLLDVLIEHAKADNILME